MEDLLSLELQELEGRIHALGHPRYRARQIFSWIHGRGVFRAEQMQNLPGGLRERLAPFLSRLPVALEQTLEAEDGTKKFRFRLQDGASIESVTIPEEARTTLCVSTQVGCALGCLFCRTGRMGLRRNLRAEEILGQYYAIRSMWAGKTGLTHVVFMGMGEPLANLESTCRALKILTHPLGCALSPRRLTVSTVGIPGPLEELFREIPVSLTLSLNAADNETRSRLMPINCKHPIEEVLATLKRLPLAPRRRFTIAYVLIGGENDSLQDARRLVRILHGVRCKINLIPFNPFPETKLKRPKDADVTAFQEFLRAAFRRSRVEWGRAPTGPVTWNSVNRVFGPIKRVMLHNGHIGRLEAGTDPRPLTPCGASRTRVG
jgi:23S rRNA (adenine2503-C2)-methyltransferase